MGGTQSQVEAEPLTKKDESAETKRIYKTPDAREKDRFLTSESSSGASSTFETSIDKFDYAIVFDLSEGKYEDTEKGHQVDMNWQEYRDRLLKCVPDEPKSLRDSIVDAMNKQYGLRNQNKKLEDDVTCKFGTFHAMARQVIIDQLAIKGGLQVKISQSGRHLICRVRAPIKMLEMQADIENYKLQFRGEIDPGSNEFWNREVSRLEPVEDSDGNNSTRKRVVLKAIEIEEERVEYDRKKGDEILDKLYKLGKIGPNELGISPNEEKPVMRNRRIHALERIADKVPIWNTYPAFAAFETDAHKRYIFQQYPGVRGKSFFLVKDRLYLTKTFLDRHFNFAQLEEFGVVMMLTALHDANRGERVSNDTLLMRWAMFWSVDGNLVGSPLVTNPEYNPDEYIAFYWRPFSQPLMDIRGYFGEKVALYYAWFGHYTYYLLFPVVASFAVWVLTFFFFPEHAHGGAGGEVDYIAIGLAIFIATWIVYYNKTWEEQSLAISYKWGTKGYEDVQKDRPEFRGDGDKKCRTFVDNKEALFFPTWKRRCSQIFSVFVITLCIIVVICVNLIMFFELRKTRIVEIMATNMDPDHPQSISSFVYLLYALLVPCFTFLFEYVAETLNYGENYRTDVDYDDALITKHLSFQVFNNFTAIFFVAFARKPLFNDCVEGDCIQDVRELLICIFLLRYVVLVIKTIYPYLAMLRAKFAADSSVLDEGVIDHDKIFYLEEIYRNRYKSPFHDYADTCIQFGFVVLFAPIVPLIATLALIENLIKMRLDAKRLCSFLRRPHVELAEDVGMWASLMKIISAVAFVVNVALIVYTSNAYDNVPPMRKALYFLVGEQVLMVYTIILAASFSDVPQWLKVIGLRNEYVIEKYLHGVDEDDDDNLTVSKEGNPSDPVDTDRLTLKAIQTTMGERTQKQRYSLLLEIDKERRKASEELFSLKNELQRASQCEIYNTLTGMGENKDGIPMGALSIKILSAVMHKKKGKVLKHQQLAFKVDVYKQNSNDEGIYEIALEEIANGVNPPPRVHGEYDTDFQALTPVENKALFEYDIVPFRFINTLKCKAVFSLYDQDHYFIGYGEEFMDDLLHQEWRTRTIDIFTVKHDANAHPRTKAAVDITDSSVVGKVTANLKFEYTKLRPLRDKIVEKQFELRETEKLVAQLQLGGEILDREWYESIVDSGAFQRFSKTAKDLFAELAKEEGVEV